MSQSIPSRRFPKWAAGHSLLVHPIPAGHRSFRSSSPNSLWDRTGWSGTGSFRQNERMDPGRCLSRSSGARGRRFHLRLPPKYQDSPIDPIESTRANHPGKKQECGRPRVLRHGFGGTKHHRSIAAKEILRNTAQSKDQEKSNVAGSPALYAESLRQPHSRGKNERQATSNKRYAAALRGPGRTPSPLPSFPEWHLNMIHARMEDRMQNEALTPGVAWRRDPSICCIGFLLTRQPPGPALAEHRAVEQLVARWAHNPKVTGSSPVRANEPPAFGSAFLFMAE